MAASPHLYALILIVVIFIVAVIGLGYSTRRHIRLPPLDQLRRARFGAPPDRGPGLGSEGVERFPIVEYSDPPRWRTRRKSLASETAGGGRPQGEPQSGPRALVSRLWSAILWGRGTADDDAPPCCSICTESLVKGVKVRKLPCGHTYHPECIDPWLHTRARTCPLW